MEAPFYGWLVGLALLPQRLAPRPGNKRLKLEEDKGGTCHLRFRELPARWRLADAAFWRHRENRPLGLRGELL